MFLNKFKNIVIAETTFLPPLTSTGKNVSEKKCYHVLTRSKAWYMSNSQFVCRQVTKEAISKEIAKALTDLCKTGGVCDFNDNETRYFS